MKVVATGKHRMNLSYFEMRAAAQFARKAGEIEQGHSGLEWGPSYDEITVYVVSAIVMAASSLEAFINEVFLNADVYLPSCGAKIKADWPTLEREEILEKFQHVIKLTGNPSIGKGTHLYQDVDTLISMRNAVVHFKPEWGNEKKIHKKIHNRTHKKFPLSPFIKGDSVFPDQCMSYGCARWCVESALKFVDAFCTRTGIENRYLLFAKHLDVSIKPPQPKP